MTVGGRIALCIAPCSLSPPTLAYSSHCVPSAWRVFCELFHACVRCEKADRRRLSEIKLHCNCSVAARGCTVARTHATHCEFERGGAQGRGECGPCGAGGRGSLRGVLLSAAREKFELVSVRSEPVRRERSNSTSTLGNATVHSGRCSADSADHFAPIRGPARIAAAPPQSHLPLHAMR